MPYINDYSRVQSLEGHEDDPMIIETTEGTRTITPGQILQKTASGRGVNAVNFGLSTESADGNNVALEEAIAEAVAKHTFVYIPSGEYVLTSPVNIDGACQVEIIGEIDAYAASMLREDVSGEKHTIHTGSCLIYRGTGAMIRHMDCTIKLSNLGIYNEKSDKSYFKTARVVGQEDLNHSKKGKIYADHCVIAGFKCAFGNTGTNEFCCAVVDHVRFSFCEVAIARNVDGRITNCSFNKCGDGVVFDGDTGFTTIANSRFEWCSGSGVFVKNNGAHEITVIGCEFDRCGSAGIKGTAGKRITIDACVFRRNGVEETSGYHVDLTGIDTCRITGCITRYMEVLDTEGDHQKKPEYSYRVEGCNNVEMYGNDWSGAEHPQEDTNSLKDALSHITGGGISPEAKMAILNTFNKVAWTVPNAQDYINEIDRTLSTGSGGDTPVIPPSEDEQPKEPIRISHDGTIATVTGLKSVTISHDGTIATVGGV